MSVESPNTKRGPLLAHALLLAWGLAGTWAASAVFLPTVSILAREHGTTGPAYVAVALSISTICYYLIYPIAACGLVALIISCLGRGPRVLVVGSRRALCTLAWCVSCLAIYLLGSGGLGFKMTSLDQQKEAMLYRLTLEGFSLLEAAEGRLENLQTAAATARGMEMAEVTDVAEFDERETFGRISTLLTILENTQDIAMKRRLLATLSLFKDQLPTSYRRDSSFSQKVSNHAAKAGVPAEESGLKALDWIAANSGKSEWNPVPLYKFRLKSF